MGTWAPVHPINGKYEDLFSVFQNDGVTKQPGETSFNVTLITNGAVNTTIPVTITEVATSPGDYIVDFTPDELGSWFLEVHVPFDDSIYSVNLKVIASGGIILV